MAPDKHRDVVAVARFVDQAIDEGRVVVGRTIIAPAIGRHNQPGTPPMNSSVAPRHWRLPADAEQFGVALVPAVPASPRRVRHRAGIVPGGGIAPDGARWIACRTGFFLPVRVLSRLFRRRFLEELLRLHEAGRLKFFGEDASLRDGTSFARWLAPLRRVEWVVYAKRPFAGPVAVLAYLSRYTCRVAISNSRLVALDERGVTFRWKDYRAKAARATSS